MKLIFNTCKQTLLFIREDGTILIQGILKC